MYPYIHTSINIYVTNYICIELKYKFTLTPPSQIHYGRVTLAFSPSLSIKIVALKLRTFAARIHHVLP